MSAFKVGASVEITTFARLAVGRVTEVTPSGYRVRLPNWQADGVHLDVHARAEEVIKAAQRASRCHCVYCGSTR